MLPRISVAQAIQAVQLLLLHEEQQSDCYNTITQHLEDHRVALKARQQRGLQQQTIIGYFT